MYTDGQNRFSVAQALTATAVSTNIIDFQAAGIMMGIGEQLTALIEVGVALAGTSPTINVAVQMATDAAFTSPVNVATSQTFTALAAGAQFAVPIPEDTTGLRYCRLNYTLGGTTPSITVTADLRSGQLLQNNVVYPKNYPIQ